MKKQLTFRFVWLLAIIFCLQTTVNAQQWTTLGSAGFSAGSATYPSIAIGANDTPYVAYGDAGNSSKATVMKYNGSTWVVAGSAGFSAGAATYTSLTKDGNDTLYVAYADGGNSSKVTVKKYNGSSWSTVGSAGFSAGSATNVSMAIDGNNIPYVAYTDGSNSNKATVMKYTGGSWSAVGGAGFTTSGALLVSLAIDPNDTLYIAIKDQNNSNKLTAFKFNGTSWVTVGSAGFTAGSVPAANGLLSMKIDANGTPYVIYRDGGNGLKATVMQYTGGSWSPLGTGGFSADWAAYPTLAINGTTVYAAYRDNTAFKAVVRKYNGSSWVDVGTPSFSAGQNNYNTMAINSYGDLFLAYQDNANSDKVTVMTFEFPNTWTGATDTTWNTASNWSRNTLPTSTESIVIENTTNAPFIATGTANCKDITISSGAVLSVIGNALLEVTGDIDNSLGGTIDATYGEVKLAGTGGQSVAAGNFTAKLLEMDNGFGATITSGTINLLETYKPSGGTLTTNGNLILKSNATTTARIAASNGGGGSYLSGNVIAERYNTGKRCYRLYAHPFTSAIALSQLTDSIDITGSGGATNGFRGTASNAPSAFWFDESAADTSASSVNSGWTAFTSANTASWNQHQLMLLFLRGSKGEGLSGSAYTASASTFKFSGTVNQGTQIVSLTKGSNTNFAAVGNPFPSGVQMQNVTPGANVGANYYAFDASVGADGAYVSNAFSLSYILPAYAGFFTTISGNTDITFPESCKEAGGAALFKTTAPDNWVELLISDSTTKWDRLLINFDDKAMDVEDKQDAKKLYNPNLDFYTLSKDSARLAIDVRPYTDSNSIQLGLTAYNRYKKYVIKTGMFEIPAGTKLVLHDKYLNKTEELKAGTEYWFDVTTDTLSQGNQRFEINMVGKPTTGVIERNTRPAQMQLIPNPAYNQVKVSFDKVDGPAQIKMMSVTGQVVYQSTAIAQTGSITIPLHNVPAGIYIVELQSNNARFTEKLIKE